VGAQNRWRDEPDLARDRVSATRAVESPQFYTDPGGPVPDWIMDQSIRKSLPWIFNGLRQQMRRSRCDGAWSPVPKPPEQAPASVTSPAQTPLIDRSGAAHRTFCAAGLR
jgi:hypothetical protein